MSCCDSEASAGTAAEECPRCGKIGTSLDPITLKALLTPDALRRGVPDAPRFCATESCPVVYFDREACVILDEINLRIRVHAKHPDDDTVPVCYCFDYTPADIEASSSTRETIAREVQAGHCACEVRNPKGSCCLGDIARVEQRLRRLVHAEE